MIPDRLTVYLTVFLINFFLLISYVSNFLDFDYYLTEIPFIVK